jgi:hypothetical protein
MAAVSIPILYRFEHVFATHEVSRTPILNRTYSTHNTTASDPGTAVRQHRTEPGNRLATIALLEPMLTLPQNPFEHLGTRPGTGAAELGPSLR